MERDLTPWPSLILTHLPTLSPNIALRQQVSARTFVEFTYNDFLTLSRGGPVLVFAILGLYVYVSRGRLKDFFYSGA